MKNLLLSFTVLALVAGCGTVPSQADLNDTSCPYRTVEICEADPSKPHSCHCFDVEAVMEWNKEQFEEEGW